MSQLYVSKLKKRKSNAHNESRLCGCHVFQETLGSTRWNRLSLCKVHANGQSFLEALEDLSDEVRREKHLAGCVHLAGISLKAAEKALEAIAEPVDVAES